MDNPREDQQQDVHELVRIRLDKIKELQRDKQDPFAITKFDVTTHSQDIHSQFEALEGAVVSIAGRMLAKRVRGRGVHKIQEV